MCKITVDTTDEKLMKKLMQRHLAGLLLSLNFKNRGLYSSSLLDDSFEDQLLELYPTLKFSSPSKTEITLHFPSDDEAVLFRLKHL